MSRRYNDAHASHRSSKNHPYEPLTSLLPQHLADVTRGQVITAALPLDGSAKRKVRPCVVLGPDPSGHALYVRPLTSSSLAPGAKALEITYWEEAGLDRPSFALLRQVTIFHLSDIRSVMGELHPDDLARLEDGLVTSVSAIPA